MKNIIYLILLLLASSCQGQHQLVEYYFSEEVNAEIDRYIATQIEANKDLSFYLTISRETMFESAGNYQIVIGTLNSDASSTVNKLANAAGRYYSYQDNNVPVVFDYDFAFAKHGEDKKGRPVRKHVIEHSYLIEFTPRDGKIVKKGN